MARRRNKYGLGRYASTRGDLPWKTALGAAREKADSIAHRIVHRMNPFEHTAADLIDWFFPADAMSILREALPLAADGEARYLTYTLRYKAGTVAALLRFEGWLTLGYCTPKQSLIQGAVDYTPLAPWIEHTNALRRDWAIVARVCGYFKENGGAAAAVRYYWPSVLALIPVAAHELFAGERYLSEPNGIAAMLPLIRASAPTVAAAKFLPESDPEIDEALTLTLPTFTFNFEGVEVVADEFVISF